MPINAVYGEALPRRHSLRLLGAAAVLALAACTNAAGTKMTTREVLQKAVRVAKSAVSFGKLLLAGFDANCAQNPGSSICTNAVIVAAVAVGRPGLKVLGDALDAATAVLADNTATEDAVGTALGTLLASQDDVQKLIDALGDKKAAALMRLDLEEIRQQAAAAGIVT